MPETCPRCGQSSNEHLMPIDAGMKLALNNAKPADAGFSLVCTTCYQQLSHSVSKGVKLRMEEKAKEKNRHMLWKSRVGLVKQARQFMLQRAYSEAAVSYEKYIRVLEMTHDLKSGTLTADVFGKSSRSKEITVIASTYWDLLRIYDTSSSYRDRMQRAAHKLAEFLPYSPIFPDVIKKAQEFSRTAKNPDIVRNFLRKVNASSPRCFIATSTYNYPQHPAVQQLRQFRDEKLLKSWCGSLLVKLYYKISPFIANSLDNHPRFKPLFRKILDFFRSLL